MIVSNDQWLLRVCRPRTEPDNRTGGGTACYPPGAFARRSSSAGTRSAVRLRTGTNDEMRSRMD